MLAPESAWKNPRPSFTREFTSTAKRWNCGGNELRCTEARFGDCASIQHPQTGLCDSALTSGWASRFALSFMLPAKPTRAPIGIADTLLSAQPLKKRADMARVSFPLPRPKTVTKPDWKADKFDRDFADAIWAIRAAYDVVCMSDDRPSMFARLRNVLPHWANFPEFFVWLSDHVTGAKSAGGSRYTITGMADRLREGPLAVAAIVDDRSIRRRILDRAQSGSTVDHLTGVLALMTSKAKPKAKPYEIPSDNLIAQSLQQTHQPRIAA
jgi:hypothetical protein